MTNAEEILEEGLESISGRLLLIEEALCLLDIEDSTEGSRSLPEALFRIEEAIDRNTEAIVQGIKYLCEKGVPR